ncbi:MAG: class B sortase [Oscillospiraceae bacterium]
MDLFAGLVTEPDSYVYATQFDADEQFLAYIESAKAESTFQSDVEVSLEDRIVVLSTCTYEFDDARYVVIGKLVEIQ